MKWAQKFTDKRGFTIVELLIVIVVIAILAAITIVSYNGISSQARESTLKSELSTAAQQLQITKLDTGSYPGSLDDIKISDAFSFTYAAEGGTFCLSGTHDSMGGKSLKVTEGGAIEEGACGVALATTMQTFTPTMCSSLSTFTGTNSTAVITLTDNRGGSEQTYEVAKLADNNCWMLSNLRLGSETSSITLTPADSDVTSDFILPQVTVPSAVDFDMPQAIGPLPGDTQSGSSAYGYLYNFPAATAGETRVSLPASNDDASYSICPAGWRLPTGSVIAGAGDFSNLDQVFGGTGLSQPDSPTHLATGWLYSGAFKGVFSGYWYGSFSRQGSIGYWWTRSSTESSSENAFRALFSDSNANPGVSHASRYNGFAVRCILRN